jgi:hypothetical protein
MLNLNPTPIEDDKSKKEDFYWFIKSAKADIRVRLVNIPQDKIVCFLNNFAMCTQVTALKCFKGIDLALEHTDSLLLGERYTLAQAENELVALFIKLVESQGEMVETSPFENHLVMYDNTMKVFFDELYIP